METCEVQSCRLQTRSKGNFLVNIMCSFSCYFWIQWKGEFQSVFPMWHCSTSFNSGFSNETPTPRLLYLPVLLILSFFLYPLINFQILCSTNVTESSFFYFCIAAQTTIKTLTKFRDTYCFVFYIAQLVLFFSLVKTDADSSPTCSARTSRTMDVWFHILTTTQTANCSEKVLVTSFYDSLLIRHY